MTNARIWNRFMFLLAVETFGETEALKGRRVKNLLGSVDRHRRLFEQAASEIEAEWIPEEEPA